MAQQLIESLVTDFEPERYKDEYREKVLELIERKASGEEITAAPEAPAPAAGAGPDGRAGGQPRRRHKPKRKSSSKATEREKTSAKRPTRRSPAVRSCA